MNIQFHNLTAKQYLSEAKLNNVDKQKKDWWDSNPLLELSIPSQGSAHAIMTNCAPAFKQVNLLLTVCDGVKCELKYIADDLISQLQI
jgi:hypothetical protein